MHKLWLANMRGLEMDHVKSVFIYHVLYGSLLVPCHRVVNKGRRLSPSTHIGLWFLLFAYIAPCCCTHSLRYLSFAYIAPAFKRPNKPDYTP